MGDPPAHTTHISKRAPSVRWFQREKFFWRLFHMKLKRSAPSDKFASNRPLQIANEKVLTDCRYPRKSTPSPSATTFGATAPTSEVSPLAAFGTSSVSSSSSLLIDHFIWLALSQTTFHRLLLRSHDMELNAMKYFSSLDRTKMGQTLARVCRNVFTKQITLVRSLKRFMRRNARTKRDEDAGQR